MRDRSIVRPTQEYYALDSRNQVLEQSKGLNIVASEKKLETLKTIVTPIPAYRS